MFILKKKYKATGILEMAHFCIYIFKLLLRLSQNYDFAFTNLLKNSEEHVIFNGILYRIASRVPEKNDTDGSDEEQRLSVSDNYFRNPLLQKLTSMYGNPSIVRQHLQSVSKICTN